MPNLKKKLERNTQWLVTLAIASFPPFLVYYLASLKADSSVSFLHDLPNQVSPHGELFIVSFALVAEVIGSNIAHRKIWKTTKNVTLTFCSIFLVFALGAWVSVSHPDLIQGTYNSIKTSQTSFAFYLMSIPLCLWCNTIGKA